MEGLFDGAPVIHAYTRADAIDDGVLIDVTDAARAAGLTLHTAVTAGAHAALGCDDAAELGRVLRAVRAAIVWRPRGEDRSFFDVRGAGGEWVNAWVHIGPADNETPVYTVMLDGED